MRLRNLDIVALLAGASLPFAFAPFYVSFLAFFSPAILLHIWQLSSSKEAFKRGFLFGLGFFSVGISWVYVSIHIFGQAPMPLALFITAVFVSYLSLFLALQGYCLNKFFPENNLFKAAIAFPCLWMLFEGLRGWLFTGFPWLFLGYSQADTWLKGYAPIFGVYGLSIITTLISALLVEFVKSKQWRFRFIVTFSIVSLFLGGLFFSQIRWTHPIGSPQKTTLIQGNIDQDLKWQPDQIFKTLKLYTLYTQKNLTSNLIIWPEAAITLPLNQAGDFLQQIGNIALKNKATIITGIPIINPEAAFNSMITIGNGTGIYHKRHLVPFGEYTPLKTLWGFVVKAFNIPMSNFQTGEKSQKPLEANGVFIAPYICYEVAYPLEFLTFLPKGQLLLTITDDSWFGHSIAAKQHLQMAQMRAIENGRYLLFSSNTGITAGIDEKGRIINSIPPFQEAVLTLTVQPMEGITPWMYWRMFPMYMLILICAYYIAIRNKIKIKSISIQHNCKSG